MLRGVVREGLTIDSQILGKPVGYGIYLPYDYETSVRAYPIIYLLHGNRVDYMSWVYFGEVNLIVDECISTRKISPMILIMPDGGNSHYINNYDQSIRYEDFFFHKLILEIESKFRIKSDKWFRGILGLSYIEGLPTDLDRVLFGICLYMTSRINEVCSLHTADVFGADGRVRDRITFRRATTKGKQETRSVSVSPELRQLLAGCRSDRPYLFPGRWGRGHICPESADAILRAACRRLGIDPVLHDVRLSPSKTRSYAGRR